jgi:hypothetical protein
LERVIVVGGRHLRRLVREYLDCCHEDRTHDGLGKGTPDMQAVERRVAVNGKVESIPLGGLQPLIHLATGRLKEFRSETISTTD